MHKALTNPIARVFMIVMVALGLLATNAAVETSTPIISSTETIVVPNVLTGEPMELEVEREATASADAAAYMYMDCSRRYTTGLQVTVAPYGTLTSKCGGTAGTGGNSISQVRDLYGPACVYYGSTLAGCVGKATWAYVGNRSGASGKFQTQPTQI